MSLIVLVYGSLDGAVEHPAGGPHGKELHHPRERPRAFVRPYTLFQLKYRLRLIVLLLTWAQAAVACAEEVGLPGELPGA